MGKPMSRKISIALAQIKCDLGNKERNIEKMKNYVKKASEQGAQLIVFPEMSLTGYTVRDLVYELAEPVPGESTAELEKVTKAKGVYMIFGMPERSEKSGDVIYNTAVLLGPEGYIGKYRKMHLPTHSVFEEKRYFRLGYETPVFDTPIGKLGLIICYDVFFPEVSRLLKFQGAELIVCISASPAVRRNFFETLTAARAIENTIFFAYVNLVGIEDGLEFWGGSRLISPSGRILTKAKYNEEDLVIEQANYSRLNRTGIFVPTTRDARPELFDELKKLSKIL